MVGGDLSLKVLVDIINALDFNGMGHAFLVSGDGKILVHPDGSKVMKSLASCSRTCAVAGCQLQRSRTGRADAHPQLQPRRGPAIGDRYVGISLDKAKAYAALDSFRTSAVVAALIAVAAAARHADAC